MTKQEEIRDKLEDNIKVGLFKGYSVAHIATNILLDQQSQGVVIRVERELPKSIVYEYSSSAPASYVDKMIARREDYESGQYSLTKAGYEATEPLIL